MSNNMEQNNMEPSKVKKKIYATKTNKGDKKALIAGVSILAAFIIFIILVAIENKIVKGVDKTGVVVAMTDVPAGIVLNENNIQTLFTVEPRESKSIPAGAYTSGYPLVGTVTARQIQAKEIVTPASLITEDLYADVEDPVELSLDVSKLGQAVGGTLRAGDIIDIKVIVDMSSKTAKNDEEGILEDVDEESGAILTDIPEVEPYDENTQPDTIEEQTNMDMTEEDTAFLETHEDNYIWGATNKYACIPVAEGVRITNVFTSAGLDTETAEADGTTIQVATVINVVVPRAMEDIIYLAMEEGNVYISRVVEKQPVNTAVEENSVISNEEELSDIETILSE